MGQAAPGTNHFHNTMTMRHYDGLYVLDIQAKEEGLKEAIDLIEKHITGLKGSVQGTQKMDKRKFERVAGKLDSGYYLNVQFSIEPDQISQLREELASEDIVYRQFYLVTDGTTQPIEGAATEEPAAAEG